MPEITLPPEDDGFFNITIGEQKFNTDLYDLHDKLSELTTADERCESIKQLCKDNGITVPVSSRRATKIIKQVFDEVDALKKKDTLVASPPETSDFLDFTDTPSGD